VTELHAGDIGAVAKLKDTLTGDTLADKGVPSLPAGEAAGALHRLRHRSQVAQRRRPHGQRVHRIWKRTSRCASTATRRPSEFLLAGTGQQHVEIVVSRLKKRYGVDVT
jgi:elongation factor G